MVVKLYSGTTRIYPHDALLRSANDFSTFTEKTTLAADDIQLAEDSAASYAKKICKKSVLAKSVGQGVDSNNPNATDWEVAYTNSTAWVDVGSYTLTVLAGTYLLAACSDFWIKPAHTRGLLRLYNATSDIQLMIEMCRAFGNTDARYSSLLWATDTVAAGTFTWKYQIHAYTGGTNNVKVLDGNMMVWRVS